METSLSCSLCAADVFHCHELSVSHADGSATCGDPWCTLPHHLHEWQSRCGSPAAPDCGCGATVVQLGGRRYTDTWFSLAS
jgi:hypothetical protein